MRHDRLETDVVAQLNIESSSQLTTLTQMRCAISIDEIEEIRGIAKNGIIFEFFYTLNAAVERRRAALSSAQQAHNEMARLLRARVGVSRSAATAC